jgi:hypothetical protein
MGFLYFFAYSHPLIGFIVSDPQDSIKGFRRRAVTLTVFLLSFTGTLLMDELIFTDDDDTTKDDLNTLKDDGEVTSHLTGTLVFSALLYAIDGIMSFYYSLPDRAICQGPCCLYARWAIRLNAVWVLILNVVLYVTLAIGQGDLFLGWLLSYAIYSLIVVPLILIFKYFCLGGAIYEENRELKERHGEDYDVRLARMNDESD